MRWNEEGLFFSAFRVGKGSNPWESSRDQDGRSEGSGGYWWHQLSWRNLECRGCRKFRSYSCSLLDCVPGLGKPSSYPHAVKTCWLWCKWGRWRTGLEKRLQKPNIQRAANRTVGASHPHPVEYPQGHPSPTSPPLPFSTSPGVLGLGSRPYSSFPLLERWKFKFRFSWHWRLLALFRAGEMVVRGLCYVLISVQLLPEVVFWKIQSNWPNNWVFREIIFHEFQCVRSRLQIQALSLSFW